ncbi:MAG TPA: hypothetical protein VJH03_10890 [Blastocatellia bacterium]|nr:hypothetical protein [Blastocatellia bacterium]
MSRSLTLGADAFEKNRRRFVGWVLRNEFSFECALEDGLTKAFGAFEIGCDKSFEFFDD